MWVVCMCVVCGGSVRGCVKLGKNVKQKQMLFFDAVPMTRDNCSSGIKPKFVLCPSQILRLSMLAQHICIQSQ